MPFNFSLMQIVFPSRPEELVLAYNGGKDSVVLIYLIHVAYQMRFGNDRPKLITIYFNLPNSFPEVKDFMLLSASLYVYLTDLSLLISHTMAANKICLWCIFRYNLDVIWLDKSFKDGLHELTTVSNEADGTTCLGRKPLRAVFMGTRRSDPGGSGKLIYPIRFTYFSDIFVRIHSWQVLFLDFVTAMYFGFIC
jgi:hypothetical protein